MAKESTEGTIREERSSPFDVGKGGILILISLLVMAGTMFVIFSNGGADTANTVKDELADSTQSGDGFETGANVSEETESNTIEIVSTDLKLLKKIGPFTLPPYEEKVNGVLVVQSESFSLDESGSYIVGITSTRDPGITFKAKCYPPKEIIILMILKDEKENPIAGSKIDTETGIYYVSRGVANPDMTAGSPLSVEKVPSSSFSGQQAKTWEVLVYG